MGGKRWISQIGPDWAKVAIGLNEVPVFELHLKILGSCVFVGGANFREAGQGVWLVSRSRPVWFIPQDVSFNFSTQVTWPWLRFQKFGLFSVWVALLSVYFKTNC